MSDTRLFPIANLRNRPGYIASTCDYPYDPSVPVSRCMHHVNQKLQAVMNACGGEGHYPPGIEALFREVHRLERVINKAIDDARAVSGDDLG